MDRLFTFAFRALVVVGALASLVVVSEVLDLYLALQTLSPVLATLFAVIVVGGLLGSVVYLGVQWYARPAVLLAPPRTADLAADVRRHAHYLARYLERLAQNPLVEPDLQAGATRAAERLRDEARGDGAGIEATVAASEREVVRPALAALRARADAEVRRCVRDVMAGVTLSPYRSADLLIVLYRNGSMVLRLTAIYASRPRLSEQLAILRDTVTVVAAVNFLNLGGKLMENFMTEVPVVGRFADDFSQGVGAGFFTSVVGHAAMHRCEAFEGWDRAEATDVLRSQGRVFLDDVKGIFSQDILPHLRKRLPQLDWERVSAGLRRAIDATGAGLDSLVTRPVLAGGRAAARTGSTVGSWFTREGARLRDAARAGWQRIPRRKPRRGTGAPPDAEGPWTE